MEEAETQRLRARGKHFCRVRMVSWVGVIRYCCTGWPTATVRDFFFPIRKPV